MSSSTNASLKSWLEFRDLRTSNFTSGSWVPLKVQTSSEENSQNSCFYIDTLVVFDDFREHHSNLTWQEYGMHRDETTAYVHEGKFFAPTDYFDYEVEKTTGLIPVTDLWHEDGNRVWDLNQEIVLALKLLRVGDKWVRPSENFIEAARIQYNEASRKPRSLEIRADLLKDYLKARSSSLFSGGFSCRSYSGDDVYDVDWTEKNLEEKREGCEWEGFNGNHIEDDSLNLIWGKAWWKGWIEKGEHSTRVAGERHPDIIRFFVEKQSEETRSLEEMESSFRFLFFESSLVSAVLKESRSRIDWWAYDAGKLGIGSTDFTFGVNSMGHVVVLARDIERLPHWFLKKLKAYNIQPEGDIGEALYNSYVRGWFSNTVAPEKRLLAALQLADKKFIARFGASLFRQIPKESDFFKKVHRFHSSSREEVYLLAKETNRAVTEHLDNSIIQEFLTLEGRKEAKARNWKSLKSLSKLVDELGGNGRELTRALAAVNDLRQLDAHAGTGDFSSAIEILGLDPSSVELKELTITMLNQLSLGFEQTAELLEKRA
jgi:hypothetical protein